MTTQAASPYLDLPALAPLERMRFSTKQRIDGAYSGRHRSRQQGGAGEFVDYREYSGGEDLRRLDWKVFARTGKAFVRLHQDETNLACTLAIDASGSMQFNGGRAAERNGSKLEYVKYFATALSHIVCRAQDQVGVAVLGAELEECISPACTLSHLARVHETIERIAAQPVQDMAPRLNDLFRRANRPGVLLLLSDFLMEDLDDVFAALRLFRHGRWEVIALHLVHPEEEQLPDGAAYRFEGMENDGYASCSPAEIREDYRRRFAAHLTAVRRAALVVGCDYRLVSTAIPYVRTLQGFLVNRSG